MVYAEKFTIGDYIEGEYVRMVGKDKTKNLNVQKIIDSNGKFVYCLEPFILVDEEKETIADLLLMDDDTMIISEGLLQGLDEELDAFLKDLLEN